MTLERNIVELSDKINEMIDKSSNVYRESLFLKKRFSFDYLVSKSFPEDKQTFKSLRKCLDHIKEKRGIYDDRGDFDMFAKPEHLTIYVESMQDFKTIDIDTPNLDIVIAPKVVFKDVLAFTVNARDVRINGGIYAFNSFNEQNKAIVSNSDRTFVNEVKLINTTVWGGIENVENPPITYEEYKIKK